MSVRTLCLVLFYSLVLLSCVSAPEFEDDLNTVVITTTFKILSVDGKTNNDHYKSYVAPGERQLTVLYRTLWSEYHCQFKWMAKPNSRYEIIAHKDEWPLTMYRLQEDTPFWALRLDRQLPEACVQQRKLTRLVFSNNNDAEDKQ